MNSITPSSRPRLKPLGFELNSVKRILLVEDNLICAEVMCKILESARDKPFVVETAARLDIGLERISEGGIDLVLLDLTLPDSEGLKTFLQMQASAPHVPIVVLTGHDDETLALQTVREGAQDYLVNSEVGIQPLMRAIRYAIERKRLEEKLNRTTEELRSKNTEMEADLHMARELQQAFLSRQKSCFPDSVSGSEGGLHFHYRYQPTSALAGDFFDVIALSDTKAGVLIADVMGHGVRAALVTAIVRGLVEELTPVALDPSLFLTEINRGLTAILRSNEWPIPVSAFYLVVDVETGHMRYANAAHPNPLCFHRDSGRVEHLSHRQGGHTGPILGVVNDATYTTEERRIAPHDLFMLYTDGLYEAENRQDECFGCQRLMEAASGRVNEPTPQLFDGLLADVRQFTGSEEFDDDVCLVGMEIMRVGRAR